MSDFDPGSLPNAVYDHEERIQALEQELLDIEQETGEDGDVETIPDPGEDGGCDCCPGAEGPGDPPIIPLPPPAPPPPSDPPPPSGTCSGADLTIVTGPSSLHWSQSLLDSSASLAARTAYAWIPGGFYLRPSSATAKTTIDLSSWTFSSGAATHFAIYAITSIGVRVATATITGTLAVFSPSVATLAYGFEVVLDAYADTDFSWTLGLAISVNGPPASGEEVFGGLTGGNYYGVQYGTGGWEPFFAVPRHIHTDIDFRYDAAHVGHVGYDYETSTLFLDAVYPMVHAEDTGGGVWVYYFQYPAGSTVGQRIFGQPPGAYDNPSGGMLTQLYNASVTGSRTINLADSNLYSVCGVPV